MKNTIDVVVGHGSPAEVEFRKARYPVKPLLCSDPGAGLVYTVPTDVHQELLRTQREDDPRDLAAGRVQMALWGMNV